jgi:hypothetical protein
LCLQGRGVCVRGSVVGAWNSYCCMVAWGFGNSGYVVLGIEQRDIVYVFHIGVAPWQLLRNVARSPPYILLRQLGGFGKLVLF